MPFNRHVLIDTIWFRMARFFKFDSTLTDLKFGLQISDVKIAPSFFADETTDTYTG